MKQYVQVVGRGVVSVRADDGKFLWNYNRVANQTANIPTPLVKDDYVFASSGYGAGAAFLQCRSAARGRRRKSTFSWRKDAEPSRRHGAGRRLRLLRQRPQRRLSRLPRLKTGKLAWEGGRGPGQGSAAVIEAEGNLYFRYQNGIMALIEANPKKYVLKGKFETATKNGEGWSHPVIVDRQLFLRDQDALLCYDIAKKEAARQTETPAGGQSCKEGVYPLAQQA